MLIIGTGWIDARTKSRCQCECWARWCRFRIGNCCSELAAEANPPWLSEASAAAAVETGDPKTGQDGCHCKSSLLSNLPGTEDE